MIVFAIDPGSKKSGYVIWDGEKLLGKGHEDNEEVIRQIELSYHSDTNSEMIVAIEQIRGYGQVAGNDTYDTCEWCGHFARYAMTLGCSVSMIPRKDVKKHLCGNTTTNDKYVRQALIDRIGDQGTKKDPGPLFGISGHLFAALAVAVTCFDRLKETL